MCFTPSSMDLPKMSSAPTLSHSPWWIYQGWVLYVLPITHIWWTFQRKVLCHYRNPHHDGPIRGESYANLIILTMMNLSKVSPPTPNPSLSPWWTYQRRFLYANTITLTMMHLSEVISFRQKVLEIHKLQIFFSLGDIVNSGIGLSYRPASLCSLADRCDTQPYAGVYFIPPVRDYEFGYCF